MGPKAKSNKIPRNITSALQLKSNKRLKKSQDDDDASWAEIGDEYMKGKTTVKPPDQLELSDSELKEEFTRILTANNPNAPDNIVRFNFKEGAYKPIPVVEQLTIHFSNDGSMFHKDSDDARRQLAKARLNSDDAQTESAKEASIEDDELKEKRDSGTGDGDGVENPDSSMDVGDGVAEEEEREERAPTTRRKSSLRNRFNFSDRASQSVVHPLCERLCETEPAPREDFSANANQGEIYDDYVRNLQAQQEQTKEKTKSPPKKDDKMKKKQVPTDVAIDDISKVLKSAKIVERMVNQNTFDDIAQDFSYFEDASDDYREQEGTLLPLWKFSFEKVKRLTVTALCWNPKHFDLFAAGYGSYEFNKQGNGHLLFYSLKNPSHPEFTYTTESGVLCLDIHPKETHLICVGFYDGNVAIFNVRDCKNKPIAKSYVKKGKHSDPVWQVKWQKNDLDNNANFFSVGADGRIVGWTLIRTELLHKEVISLVIDRSIDEIADKSVQIKNLGSGTTFDFHRKRENLFLVGTEEGKIHKCSKAYSSRYLGTIDAHRLVVNAVRWNLFHTDVFISCSADWTIKIWDYNYRDQAMFTYDLACPVADVAWAPYSSTVFAAVTTAGKVHVFDLITNKYKAMCQQSVVQKRRTKPTRIEFNPEKTIVIVGDDRGNVSSLKLSPNLRKVPKVKKGQPPPKLDPVAEVEKMDKILNLVREPEYKEN